MFQKNDWFMNRLMLNCWMLKQIPPHFASKYCIWLHAQIFVNCNWSNAVSDSESLHASFFYVDLIISELHHPFQSNRNFIWSAGTFEVFT